MLQNILPEDNLRITVCNNGKYLANRVFRQSLKNKLPIILTDLKKIPRSPRLPISIECERIRPGDLRSARGKFDIPPTSERNDDA